MLTTPVLFVTRQRPNYDVPAANRRRPDVYAFTNSNSFNW